MTETAFTLVLSTVFWWMPAAWVFFDAEERDSSSYLWGAVSLVFGLFGVIVYFIVRSRRPPAAVPYSRGRIYLHVGLLTFWGLSMVAVSSLVWGLLQATDGERIANRDEDPLRASLAFAVATAVIAAPAFVAHAVLLRRTIRSTVDGAVRLALARMQEGFAWLTVVIAGIIGAFGAAVLIYGGVGFVFDLGSLSRDGGAWSATACIVAAFSLLITFALFFTDPAYRQGRVLLEQQRALDRAPAPVEAPTVPTPATRPSPPSPNPPSSLSAPRAFCAACGAPRSAEARFCAGCGVEFEVSPS